jgi:ribosomal protein S18 acetylase RimI-like enzyme
MNWHHNDYLLTDAPERMDLDAICNLLHSTYWASTRSRDVIEKTLRHSLNFGLFRAERQIGFARVVSDRATVGYLCDVIIAPEQRGAGLGQWMLGRILEHPELKTCRIDLFTRDAQEFYARFGFGPHTFTNLVRYPPDYAGGGIVAPVN